MTGQTSDTLSFEDKNYSIAGESGNFFFDPEMHGITLGRDRTLSSCWHGYICHYEVKDQQLYLKDLRTVATPAGKLNGIEVSAEGHVYRSAYLPINFTGGLLIASDFIDELDSHMGFKPAWKYKNVIELIFKDGHLENVHHASDAAAEYRLKFINRSSEPTFEEMQNGERSTKEWIEETFTLKYK